MRIKQIILIVLILTSNWALFGQLSNELKQYKHHSIISENDTVNYHTYSKTGIESINTLFLYLQGSSAKPVYQVKE
ncbi:MAG: hypothetical protein WBN54_05550, partial [Robiginitalea sp.]